MNVHERYLAKVAARANGTTPLIVVSPEPGQIRGSSPDKVDERYKAKLVARSKAAVEAPVVAAAPASPAAPVKGPEHAPQEVVAEKPAKGKRD